MALERIAKPKPGADQVLIKVHASSVNPVRVVRCTGKPYFMRLGNGIGTPSDLRVGYDMAGIVEAVGANVTRFKPGDEVFGGATARSPSTRSRARTATIVAKPAELSFEEAAAMPIAAITALQGLRDHGHVNAGTEGAHQRRFRRSRHLRGADRQSRSVRK